jgi:tryptophanyl-tRNA synthetase
VSDLAVSSALTKNLTVMAGMRTTGRLHIGHYFGALKNFIKLQHEFKCYFGVMDLHGMTTAYKKTDEISAWNRDVFADWLAWGLDPQKCTLFIQSQIPEHLELFMIFANLTPMGWLERVPTWKDAEEEAKATDTHNLGRFSYPVLQAADVAIYKGALVPVGQDQVAHLELTREIVRRFNHIYKAKWPEPKALLTETPLLPGLDGRKMSKSYANGIDLGEESKSIAKKIRAMPTDPQRVKREDAGDPQKCNVFTYHKLFSTDSDQEWVIKGCTTAGIGCGDCKGKLIENMEKLLAEPRERKKEILNKPKDLDLIINDGNSKARKDAQSHLREVKEIMRIL